ncbi:MAG: GntR family transcriptional regulator [Blastocatellia bacterium]
MISSAKLVRVAAPLRQQVTEVIRKAIHDNTFPPGSRLGERELCDYTGVSRTSVREAIRQLEAEGYVRMIPNKGPVVSTIDVKEAVGIYQLRCVLEGLAARLFTQHASKEQKRLLRAAVKKLEDAIPGDDTAAWLPAITDFYSVLSEGSGNEPLRQVLTTLQGRTTILRATSVRSAGRMKKSIQEIKQILKAIESGDAETAERASIDHVQRAAAVALAMLAQADADDIKNPRG